jgi:hypothetical protein
LIFTHFLLHDVLHYSAVHVFTIFLLYSVILLGVVHYNFGRLWLVHCCTRECAITGSLAQAYALSVVKRRNIRGGNPRYICLISKLGVPCFWVASRHQRFFRHVIDYQDSGKCLGVFKSLELCGHQLRPHFELLLVFLILVCWNQTT